jgi:O-antigen ligase
MVLFLETRLSFLKEQRINMRINWQEPKAVAAIIILAVILIAVFLGKTITGYSYKVAIAIALSALIFVLTFINTDAGLAVLIFSMLLSPEIMIGQLPGRDIIIRFDDILLMVITLAWLAKAAINKGLALFIKTPLNKAMGVYILICLIATLRGAALGLVVPEKGLFYILRYAEYFLLYILVANHIHSRKQIKFFLTVLFITCAIVSVYGILQIPQGVRVSAPFEGETGEPNTFGGYLLFISCVAIGLFLQNIGQGKRLTLIGLAVLMFVPFLYTLSRASYLGVVFSFLVFIIMSKKRLLLFVSMLAIVVLIALLKPEAVFSRVEYTFQEKKPDLARIFNIYLDPSASARIFSWQDSFKAWKESPILGRGISGHGLIDGQYIRTLPEIGALGLVALLWLLWSIFKHSLGVYKKMDDELYQGLTLGFIAGFIGLAVHAFTANTFIIIRIMEPFWFITAIIMMLPALKEKESLQQESILL